MYYVVYDKDAGSETTIYGVFNSMKKAYDATMRLAFRMTEDCFAVDPEESGLIKEIDYETVFRECKDSIGIKAIEYLNREYY